MLVRTPPPRRKPRLPSIQGVIRGPRRRAPGSSPPSVRSAGAGVRRRPSTGRRRLLDSPQPGVAGRGRPQRFTPPDSIALDSPPPCTAGPSTARGQRRRPSSPAFDPSTARGAYHPDKEKPRSSGPRHTRGRRPRLRSTARVAHGRPLPCNARSVHRESPATPLAGIHSEAGTLAPTPMKPDTDAEHPRHRLHLSPLGPCRLALARATTPRDSNTPGHVPPPALRRGHRTAASPAPFSLARSKAPSFPYFSS